MRQTFYRLFDVTCAAVGLLVLTPVLAALAVLILWNDGRPVLFSQMRVGRRGKLFRIWKFRTMRPNGKGGLITAAGDKRVTRTGAVLRRFKLDELPQLFNVLKGDMSLVGPRPEVPECVQLEAPIWQAVLQVRPGVTDLATLLYRDEETLLGMSSDPEAHYRETVLPAKLVLNLVYLRSKSFWSDLRLLFFTVQYSLVPRTIRRGSYRKDLWRWSSKMNDSFISFHRPSIGEEEITEVVETLKSGWLTTGPRVARFEREFRESTGALHAIAVNSATAGLHLALAALEIGPGQEVITTPMTFCATVQAILHVGAIPVLADIGSDGNIDPGQIEKRITSRTRAIIPVHMAGLPCDMEAIWALAKRRGIHVIEDAAHAAGAFYNGRPIRRRTRRHRGCERCRGL